MRSFHHNVESDGLHQLQPPSIKRPEQIARSTESSFEELTADCKDIENIVASVVDEVSNDFSPRIWGIEKKSDGVLRSAGICRMASAAAGHMLTMLGYPTREVHLEKLQSIGAYPYNTHSFIIVDLRESKTVIDFAYYQNIRILGLRCEEMPEENIFISRVDELDEKIAGLAELRKLNDSDDLTVWVRNFFYKKKPVPLNLTVEGLKYYFSVIWDISDSRHIFSSDHFYKEQQKDFLNKNKKIRDTKILEAISKRWDLSSTRV